MPNYHVADIIARIKNALQKRKATVILPNTQFVYAFMTCLVNEGYVENFSSLNIIGGSFRSDVKVPSSQEFAARRIAPFV